MSFRTATRVLPDGRMLVVYERMFNSLLTVSTPLTPGVLPGVYDDDW